MTSPGEIWACPSHRKKGVEGTLVWGTEEILLFVMYKNHHLCVPPPRQQRLTRMVGVERVGKGEMLAILARRSQREGRMWAVRIYFLWGSFDFFYSLSFFISPGSKVEEEEKRKSELSLPKLCQLFSRSHHLLYV